jgi:hypothetical protein
MNKPLILIGLWILFSIAPVNAQSTTGTRGLVKAPTARMFEDGTLSLGAAFIPPGYHKRTFGAKKGDIVPNAGLNTFVTVNLFPFMEVMFRYSHELNLPSITLLPKRLMHLQNVRNTQYFLLKSYFLDMELLCGLGKKPFLRCLQAFK